MARARRPCLRPDHRTSDADELAAWSVLTRAIAWFPELLARHPEWLAALIEKFDSPASWRVADGARELFATLRARGLRLAVVSNWHTALHRILDGLGLDAQFDLVLCSGAEGFEHRTRDLPPCDGETFGHAGRNRAYRRLLP
jgi:FMN phosphatase YigB (HAD superfamily)